MALCKRRPGTKLVGGHPDVLLAAGQARMRNFLFFIDELSTWVGKAFAWLILILSMSVTYEVFVRYALNAPTTWAFDFSYITYGGLFLMSGAYALARNNHVRCDFIYRTWAPRTQATIDLVLFVLFFLPGVLALVYAGFNYASMSVGFREVSVFSPAGIPVFPLKALIPLAGTLLLIQGVAEIIRCILCIRDGQWPQRLHDVEEMETVILHQQQYLAEHDRQAPSVRTGGSA
ncbi:TRAP transporter small permease subunit [Bradyrhizobium sp. NC92]|uniref:TRAP transporter small permease subunit n=1 Tax=Bradyrhizobium sp. (strain NC92) TaxID=55395 RepID=UPI0021AAF490|nr:TRAP transporter small permease subunit [Bradyrhizobium sp. NC92]UWU72374.1 TRAP transporter small permease subunit [Bradyrhizobium sp. NC92]